MALKIAAPKDIPTQIKDKQLVQRRRRQIVDAAVELFLKNGFHKTTTRQIAQAAGISIGLLYEYISTKEDILYLVCEAIHAEMENAVTEALARAQAGRGTLEMAIQEYFKVCHRMSDHILLIYQETQSLPSKWRKIVLANEIQITGLFTKVLAELVDRAELPFLDAKTLDLMAHNISVLGHMWTFRRWFMGCHYTIEEYTRLQTEFILGWGGRSLGAGPDTRKDVRKKNG
jgi:TetR/AcrR family transcriptional regulator, cholesterol catabolism regulator